MRRQKVKITPHTYLSLIRDVENLIDQIKRFQRYAISLHIVDRTGFESDLEHATSALHRYIRFLHHELAKLLLEEFLKKAKK